MRQPQRVWKTFYRLKLRANFFVGKAQYEKTSFCTARSIHVAGPVKFVAPWTVVRSDEYVNKKLIAAKLSDAVAKVRTRSGDGHTHYVGDDCPGGHADCAPKQPSSDNGVSGPTS